ncbi:MAG: tail fiber domain-containing protein [Rhodocyclaceae bacterium]|nr:tail fiber domain-containing protein [Rhodocyclaceae bacterium]
MDTKNFKDRSTLQSYFLKNKIPTEDNFRDLINSTLNQNEDGICKPAGDPLSITATGDGASPQKLINFYGNVSDPNPAWTLQMNPRSDQNNPATAKAGFSVSDGQGTSRLFVDKSSGNIGIGTISPLSAVHLRKDSAGALGPRLTLMNGAGSAGAGAAIDFDGYDPGSNDPTARIQSSDNGNFSSHLLFLTKDSGAANKPLQERMRITWDGNVGIGAPVPNGKLDVANLVRLGFDEGGSGSKSVSFARDSGDDPNSGKIAYKGNWGTALHIVGAGALPRKIKLWDNVEVAGALTPSAGNSASNGIMFPKDPGGGGSDAAWMRYYPRSGESCTLEIGTSNDADDHIALMPSGGVGIGTNAPGAKLDIVANTSTWGGWYEAIRLSQSAHSAITHPGGGLLFGLHSNRNFYFADTTGGKYVMTIEAPTGNTTVSGAVFAGNSDIYFSNTSHTHTGTGNNAGYAAIENASNYGALMILGRTTQTAPIRRVVKVWDYLEVIGTFVNNSDEKGKKDIEDLQYGLEDVKKLRPVSFNWKELANPHKCLGLIAQDVKSVINEVVYADDSSEGKGNLSVGYINLIPVLINAIKELDAKLGQLEAQTAAD